MSPERWQQINDLFDAALLIDSAERERWLRQACDSDENLRAEVGRLLAGDERAGRGAFLLPPDFPAPAVDPPGSVRPGHADRQTSERIGPSDPTGFRPADPPRGFTPKPALAPRDGALAMEIASLVRKRLRALAIIYLCLFGILPVWRVLVRRESDWTITACNALVVVSLALIIARLSGRRPLSPGRLKSLELGMVGLIACLVATIYYRRMLTYALQGELTKMQIQMEHFVLYAAVLILTFGLATPKRGRQAALIVVPLAVLPFVTLLVLCLRQRAAMEGLGRWTAPYAQLSFDAMVLLILAVGSAYETRSIYRLRRQVAEVLQLNQYHLRRRLGGGGMGEVYLAEHQLLKRPCALKLIRQDDAADPNALARFEREVQITATLSHPNIVEIYDYGRTEDGTYYYVMEYLSGLSLEELVKHHGPLPPGRVVHVLRQVCLALRTAHAAGLIHRDIKPSNIIATRSGGVDDVAKLLDFGLVIPVTGSSTPHLTKEGQLLGTPLFMPPERVMGGGQGLDVRSDLYALGAVAYYMLTGRPPFEGGDDIAVIVAHARDPVVPPSRHRADVPDDLERVVLRCLAKPPSDRFPDAESLAQALAACACASEWDQQSASRWWHDRNENVEPPVR